MSSPDDRGNYPKPNEVSFLAYLGSLVDVEAKVYAQSYWNHLLTGTPQPDLTSFEGLTYSEAQQIRLKLATLI
jgi:hypothetical protein